MKVLQKSHHCSIVTISDKFRLPIFIKGLSQIAQQCWFNILFLPTASLFLFNKAGMNNVLNQQCWTI